MENAYGSYAAIGNNADLCPFYFRNQVHSGSSKDPDRGVHPSTKTVQDC